MKRVLVISSSPNKNGNSALLCQQFIEGAKKNNEIEYISLSNKKIGYCVACQYCKMHDGKCVIEDDMTEIFESMKKSDVIVLASPVYFYSITAQMKTLLDRTYCDWMKLKNKELYFLMTSADDTDTVMDTALACFRGWEKCLDHPVEKGVIYGKGAGMPGDIKTKDAYKEAYEMGKGV